MSLSHSFLRRALCAFVAAPLLLLDSSSTSSIIAQVPAAKGDTQAAAGRFAEKLEFIQRNAGEEHPDQKPTVFTEEEINGYLAEGRVKLPQGVQQASFQLQPGIVTTLTRIDFDQLEAGRSSSNPLLQIFSGVHDVRVAARAAGSGGTGRVHVDSVALDNAQIPRFVLEIFVKNFLQPKYPKASLDSEFKLPAKLDLAIVGERKLTVTQK